MTTPISFPNATVTVIGIEFDAELTQTEWKAMWPALRAIHGSINFVLGDWINHGIVSFGDKYSKALEITEAEYQTLANCSWVCRAVPLSIRRPKLDWSHHKEVASLALAHQKRFLKLAEEKELTVSELRSAIREALSERQEERAPNVGFVPRVWVGEGLRWLQRQSFDEWEPERKTALRRELEPIVRVYEALGGCLTPR